MLSDREENKIILSDKPNPHTLILGGSGQGKTFYCYRRIEEEFERGRRAIIYDYSGSYQEKELENMNFRYAKDIRILNPCTAPYYVLLNTESADSYQKIIVDSLVNVLGIQGYMQKTVLSQALGIHMKSYTSWNFEEFFCTLKIIYNDKKNEGGVGAERDSLLKILTRMEPYADIHHIRVMQTNNAAQKAKTTIVQLSDFPECQRHFLTEFFINLLWSDVTMNAHAVYDLILADEFQHLSMNQNGALSKILREGRKYNVALILSSQFIGNYDMAEKETILQAGNIFLFKPAAQDRRAFADIIGGNKPQIWLSILDKLQIGEAVLAGNYTVNGGRQIWKRPIVCKVR